MYVLNAAIIKSPNFQFVSNAIKKETASKEPVAKIGKQTNLR